MGLRPMLFVGCGGAGGATLQYVMDYLKTDIIRAARAKSVHDYQNHKLPDRVLPQAWQFVHIDLPDSPDTVRVDGPPSVARQGGRYVSLRTESLTWERLALRVWQIGGVQHPELMSGWLKRPGPNDLPLADGTGQDRAVGRGITLKALTSIRDELAHALSRLHSMKGTQELRHVADLLDTSVTASPLVFIVSSMCGGTGAGMVIDVARLLTRLNHSLAPSTSLLLYTPEVYAQMPQAVRRDMEPNALAFIGELLATSLGANTEEGELLQQFGINGNDVEWPFKRAFPIGGKHGQRGSIIGDGSHNSVFRAMGRGLASLVSSAAALHEFQSLELTNVPPQRTDLSWLGEGSPTAGAVQWGSFGFARLTMGRDRYGEYVAQRLARLAVDRIVEGHAHEDPHTGDVALRTASTDWLGRVERDLGFPSHVTVVTILGRGGRFDEVKTEIRRNSRDAMQRLVFSDRQIADRALPGPQLLRILMNLARGVQWEIQRAIKGEAYALVHAWHASFISDLLLEINLVIADKGITVAREVLLYLRHRVAEWRDKLRAEANRLAPQGAAIAKWVDSDVEFAVASAPNLAPAHPLRRKLREGFSESMSRATAGTAARLLADVLTDFWPSFGEPLVKALGDEHDRLVSERSRPVRPMAVADLRSTVYAEWPVPGNPVPDRFRGAHNEVVLVSVDHYPAQFDAHMEAVARVRTGGSSTTETIDTVLREIITDRWSGRNDLLAGSSVITMPTRWVPELLTVDPHDRAAIHGKSAARFAFRLSPTDVLDRAREWVWRPDGEIGPFLNEGLRSYMDPSKREFESRRLQLASQFETTMQQALPLVSVDPVAYAKVHVDPLVENFGFSTLPFAGLAGVDEILRQVIRDRPSVSHEAFGAFEDALGQGSEVAHIDVFSSYSPMSPLAFASLLQPMNNAWREAVAEGNTRSFWTNRRARPLTGSLAMSVTERRASAAGYVVGKITGRLRGTYEAMHNEPGNQWRTNPGMRSPERLKRLEIYSQVKHGWLPFPNPLLTPYEPGTFGGPTFLVDELPAILESHLLAIAECGFDTSFDPLLPYLELRRLFANVVQAQIAAEAVDVQGRAFDRSAGVGCLSEWIVDGTRPLGAPPANELLSDDGGLPFDLDTRAGRSAAALSYCEVSGDKFARAERADDGTADSVFSAFDRRPLMAWLAPDMVWACTEVAELVRKIHVPQRTKARPKMRAADGHVFISHASDDSVLATRLVEELENRGLPCWMAARGDVEAGQHYGAAILESIVASRAMVVLISTSALESPNVDREFSLAIDHRKPIVPIALSRDAISLESLPGQWHYYLATAQVRHFTNVSETATNIQAVVRELPGAARP